MSPYYYYSYYVQVAEIVIRVVGMLPECMEEPVGVVEEGRKGTSTISCSSRTSRSNNGFWEMLGSRRRLEYNEMVSLWQWQWWWWWWWWWWWVFIAMG